ncbi:MAG: diguanylate cyclase domain-containing protein [Synechococcus lacustris]
MQSLKVPRIVWVSLSPAQPTGPKAAAAAYEPIGSLSALLQGPRADVVVLDGSSELLTPALLQLRRHPDYGLSLIFFSGSADRLAEALADGPLPAESSAVIAAWRHWQERLGLFNRGRLPDRFDHSLLCWLWLRPAGLIQPVCDPSNSNFYHYPLVEALAGEGSINVNSWLQQKRQENLLEAGDLLDRLRHCTACDSNRLNYVDVCPECHGLDIVRQPSLHCFVCGHVAPQQDFLRGDGLICPNCLSHMRHIGSDYDRPLENYRCRSCNAFFEDAEVDVCCIECGQRQSPDELRVREIRPFRLSETGQLSCRQGLGEDSVASQYFRQLKLMAQPGFLAALDWQIAITRRYGKPRGTSVCSVLGMRFDNLKLVLNELGEPGTIAMLDSLMERLQQVIRETDRCMRGREDVLWILLPETPAAGLDILQERLLTGLESIESSGGQKLQLRIVGCGLPDQLEKNEDAPLLLARLMGELF